jgi:hypothetical protein
VTDEPRIEMLCGDWAWDSFSRELKHYPRRGRKGHAPEPDAVEQVQRGTSLTLHLWSQQPMQTATGEMASPQHARILLKYEDGRELEINEPDRACAEKLATTLSEASGLPIVRLGSPTGRRGGNLPEQDSMGRWVYKGGRLETALDESAGILEVTRKGRLFGKSRKELRTTEIYALELDVGVRGGNEVFTVNALLRPEDERVPIASYAALEGWSDHDEWRVFTEERARSLGVEARLPDVS